MIYNKAVLCRYLRSIIMGTLILETCKVSDFRRYQMKSLNKYQMSYALLLPPFCFFEFYEHFENTVFSRIKSIASKYQYSLTSLNVSNIWEWKPVLIVITLNKCKVDLKPYYLALFNRLRELFHFSTFDLNIWMNEQKIMQKQTNQVS